jgi:hypothetical protein
VGLDSHLFFPITSANLADDKIISARGGKRKSKSYKNVVGLIVLPKAEMSV